MKRIFSYCFFTLFLCSGVWAQGTELDEDISVQEFAEDVVIPDFEVALQVPVGAGVIFDASSTRRASPSYGTPTYSWDFGDKQRPKWGEQVEYAFENAGTYEVTLSVKQGVQKKSITKEIIVYDRKAVLFTDKKDTFVEMGKRAGEEGVWLKQIIYNTDKANFSAEQSFIQSLGADTEFIKEADTLLFYTDSFTALQGFAQFWQQLDEEQRFDIENKVWVQISEQSLDKGVGVIKSSFSIINPKAIILTRPESLSVIFKKKENTDELIKTLITRAIEYKIVDQNTLSTFPLFFISRLTTYFIANGIPIHVIYLLFAVPFITFVIAFARQFVGVSTLGVYAPLMLTLSFLVLGLSFGFVVFIAVMCVSYLIRMMFEKVELLYIPRVALLLSMLSLSFFLILGGAVHFQVSASLALSVFPMLVMSTLSEKFLSAQSEGGMKSAIIATSETVLVSLLAYGLVQWDWLHTSIIAFPELIFLPMIGIVWLGRFTGLRLSEYFKFRALYKDDNAEEE